MAISSFVIYWLAGLLEGEGCFSGRQAGHNPIIQLVMTDPDVVIKAAKLLGAYRVIKAKPPQVGNKAIYRTVIYGHNAMGWMMTLYSLLGLRRQEKITTLLNEWKNKKHRQYPERRSPSRGEEVVYESAGG